MEDQMSGGKCKKKQTETHPHRMMGVRLSLFSL
jgi:hypothetical protein